MRPTSIHVAVAENMFGDIVSDLAAGIAGSLGLAPSGDIEDVHAVFQPSHRSAPTIAGKNIATTPKAEMGAIQNHCITNAAKPNLMS